MILRLLNLNVIRGRTHVLHDLNLEIEEGSIFALIGANGAGKSTLLTALSGLIPIRSGQAIYQTINGSIALENTKAEKIVAKHLIHCPEGRQIFPRMTVEENLHLGAYLVKDSTRIKRNIEKAYSLFPILGERKKLKAGALSGGEQMMLAVARALMGEPKLLLLDEPSLGLAPQITEQIFDQFKAINETLGVTILLVEQNATMALEIANMGAVLEQGRLSRVCKAEELLHDESIVTAYLGV